MDTACSPGSRAHKSIVDQSVRFPVVIALQQQGRDFNSIDTGNISEFVNMMEQEVGKIAGFSIKKRGDMFVYAVDADQKQALLRLSSICDVPVRVGLSQFETCRRGVIRDVDLRITDSHIVMAASEQGVVAAKRLHRSSQGIETALDLVVLTFRCEVPKTVQIDQAQYPIINYHQKPIQCKKCWGFGHISTDCTAEKTMCGRCGGSECCRTRPCYKQLFCLNCMQDDHGADNVLCVEFLYRVKLLEESASTGISVKEARSILAHRATTRNGHDSTRRQYTSNIRRSGTVAASRRKRNKRKTTLSCVQWNASGLKDALYKTRLDEFKANLTSLNPDVVFLSETHWKDDFKVNFRAYHTFFVNRGESWGGVAVLIRKSFQYSLIELPLLASMEAVGVRLTQGDRDISVISVYAPHGNCTSSDINTLFEVAGNSGIVAGDFNAHHSLWESRGTVNTCGRSIANFLEEDCRYSLCTPIDLGTRVGSGETATTSTIDLTFVSNDLPRRDEIKLGPYWGSDHLPILFKVEVKGSAIMRQTTRRWRVRADSVTAWNDSLRTYLTNTSSQAEGNPLRLYESFKKSLERASNDHFVSKRGGESKLKEPPKPWWDSQCKLAIAKSRRARAIWRRWPTLETKNALNKSEARKKRVILKAKRASMRKFGSTLGRTTNPTSVWSFARALMGSQGGFGLRCPPIKTRSGGIVHSTEEKAAEFAKQYLSFGENAGRVSEREESATMHDFISDRIKDSHDDAMSTPFTRAELNAALSNLKSKATGTDEFSYQMLGALDHANRDRLLGILNRLLAKGGVPSDWRESLVIPLLKPGKSPDSTESYRPISLTSCLGKVMERLINTRLKWFFERHNVLPNSQAGFRPGYSTIDHIVTLESGIRVAFNKGLKVCAVFLDMSKAYDTTWHTGLLYKLAKVGVKGKILLWLKNFLKNRIMHVLLDGIRSRGFLVTRGVPQGSVISPLLFNTMMYDFPTVEGGTCLYADDIVIYIPCSSVADAEAKIQPVLDDVNNWAKKWKLDFAVIKSTVVVFSRNKNTEREPDLLLAGNRIPVRNEVRFLGVIFDSRLLFRAQINDLINRAQRKMDLLKTMSRHGLNVPMPTLVTIYKAFIRSSLEYGSFVLNGIAKGQLERIERVQYQALRLILGAFPSTPIEQLHTDTGIEKLSTRRSALYHKYLIKLNTRKESSAYTSAVGIIQAKQRWKPRSTPSLIWEWNNLRRVPGVCLFNKRRRLISWVERYHPSNLKPVDTIIFPISKREALRDKCRVQAEFTNIMDQFDEDTTVVYTDGSVIPESGSASCAAFFIKTREELSWRLKDDTSILAAELHAIRKSLDHLYNRETSSQIVIITDSLTAVNTIRSNSFDTHPCVARIVTQK